MGSGKYGLRQNNPAIQGHRHGHTQKFHLIIVVRKSEPSQAVKLEGGINQRVVGFSVQESIHRSTDDALGCAGCSDEGLAADWSRRREGGREGGWHGDEEMVRRCESNPRAEIDLVHSTVKDEEEANPRRKQSRAWIYYSTTMSANEWEWG